MATDRDGRPAPPVGSKVRFNYTNGFTYEGVVTKIDPSPYITLAALRDKVITHCPPKILSDMCGALYQLIFYFPAQNN